MIYLGADIGTTRIKAIAYCDDHRRVLATASVQTPVHPTADGATHDPATIREQVLHCLREVVAQLPDRSDVAAICVASLGEEVVLVDEDGTPLGPTPTWYDSPGRAYAAAHPRATNPTYSLFLLRWFAERRAPLAAATVRFTDLGSYVTAALAGLGTELIMDQSHASRTGFFDLRSRRFDADDLSWAGGWADKAPRLVPSGTVVGSLAGPVARQLGLSGDIAVVSGAHDHFAAAFASGVRSAGDAMLSVGTSEAVFVLAPQVPDEAPASIDIGAFVDDRTWYVHRNVRGGQLFSHWRQLLNLPPEPAATWFEPETWPQPGSPVPLCLVDPDLSTATFANLPFTASPTDVMRALAEGLALNCRAMLAETETASGIQVRSLTVAGPAGDNDAWLRMRAAILGRHLRVVRTPEPTALGAAVLAQGAVRGEADVPVETIHVPPPDTDEAQRYYTGLLDAHGRARREPLTQLNRLPVREDQP
ncbi:FGGY-family carbohydrate kinase [Planosporangium thailandense]|uniref:FGGY-family carbohydrate kinase n=1 Tax=Planosporangium thailandense TaxID=765197 RepID=A0ABX0XTL0_9ACTN|nr:FGGY-family carbohydrate kinase [Planosporangium thailandense]NJC69232.1 FGGY-family carbohydrate kinase [Planosporangium thailandense]